MMRDRHDHVTGSLLGGPWPACPRQKQLKLMTMVRGTKEMKVGHLIAGHTPPLNRCMSGCSIAEWLACCRAYSKEFFGVHNFKSSCMM